MHTEPFDFDTLIDRSQMGCAKWNRRTPEETAMGVVPMSIADMEFRCPPCVIDAVTRAAQTGVYGYTDADDPYYEAVAGWMLRRHGWQVERDWIVPENGVVPAMCVAVRAFTAPGDRVLLQSPGYSPFRMAVELNGREVAVNRLLLGEDGLYRMDLQDLEAKLTDPRVTMMFLCSPHNPVGRIWTVEELRAVAGLCAKHGVSLVSDEIHFDLELYGKHTALIQAAPEIADRCAILTAPSKTFNVAGLQLANMIIPNAAMRSRYKARMNADGYSNVSLFGYHATIAAYTQGDAWLDALLAYLHGNFKFLKSWLTENMPRIRLLPVQGTYLAWTDWRSLRMTGAELDAFARGEAKLVLNEGSVFGDGGEGFMRMNLALPRKELEKALARLKEAAARRGIL